MEINQETIRFFQSSDDKLCNDYIFNALITKLEKINFAVLDNSKSEWSEVNEQSQVNKEYKIVITSKNQKQIFLSFLLWDSFINIYVGKEQFHFADDAQVRNEKEFQDYSRFLNYLFDCKIKETIFYKSNKIVGYDYEFMNKESVVHTITHNKLSKIFYDKKVVNLYKSWID